MGSERLIIFDTTLRDGEQSPGASMTRDEKVRIARQLERLRVDVIEAGFAAASNGDFESVQAIARAVKNSTVCSLSRANDRDISRSAEALKDASRARIHTFIATSPLHMEKKLRMTPEQVLEQAKQSVRFARNRLIGGQQEARSRFEQRDFRAEPLPDRSHLKADHTGADHAEALRNLRDLQRSGVVENQLVVERHTRQFARLRASRQDHMASRDDLPTLAIADFDLPQVIFAAKNSAVAKQACDLILLEQESDTLRKPADDLVLAHEHLADIEFKPRHADAVHRVFVRDALVILRGFKQRLRRNTADIQASSAQARLAGRIAEFVDTGSSQSELRRADCRDITAGTGADHHDIEWLGHGFHL